MEGTQTCLSILYYWKGGALMFVQSMNRLSVRGLEFSFGITLVLALVGNPLIAAEDHLGSSDPEPLAMVVTLLGYRAYQGGGGAITTSWTTGNLGNTWDEGEWIPYELMYEYVEPGLADLDSIIISFDFTYRSPGDTIRFIDLVRDLQAGTIPLADDQGWVGPDGTALPVSTREEIEAAQTYPLEHAWNGFTLLDLPNERINRTLSGREDIPPGEERHIFKIYKSDLLAAGIDIDDSTVVVYFQLHESRSFVWRNQLQAGYDLAPTDGWGGYLYGTDGWPTAGTFLGSGYVPGSSGHVDLVESPVSRAVPIPIPQAALGILSGFKWGDDDGNGVWDGPESGVSGWQLHLFGTLETVDFTVSAITNASGYYSFPDLSTATVWVIKEDSDRYDPPETGYGQTHPTTVTTYGLGAGIPVGPPPPGVAEVGWEVELTRETPVQDSLNFGNALMGGMEENPYGLRLGLGSPNPISDATVITYSVPSPSKVHLAIWTVRGELVQTLISAVVEAGPHHVKWNGRLQSGRKAQPGIYLCRLHAGGQVVNHKIVLVE